jgi:CO/xanthine dehydrogenase FAD-binding subunit
MVALGARYEITDGRESRELRAEEFHTGFLTTQLAEDELAAAAVLVRIAGGVIVESRVAVGGVSDRPVRLADVEISLSGAAPGEVGGRVGPIRGIRPVSDTGASASYRAHICRVLVTRALAEAAGRSAGAA